MEGAITEQKTGNPLVRAANKVFGLALGSEYLVPDKLNHKIELPSGATMELKGPREDLEAYYRTPEGRNLLMNSLAPDGSHFEINESKMAGWEADSRLDKVLIPSNLILLGRDTMYGAVHEISHLWVVRDIEYSERQKRAKEVLGEKLRAGLPEYNLSNNPEERIKEINAWKVIDESEERSAEIALYIFGKLRLLGFDLLPQNKDSESLMALVNPHLASHREFGQKLTLSRDKIENIINGNLPYPGLKEKIDDRLSKVITS